MAISRELGHRSRTRTWSSRPTSSRSATSQGPRRGRRLRPGERLEYGSRSIPPPAQIDPVPVTSRRVYTNLPYSIAAEPDASSPAYFLCRRHNWSADCHLMRATHDPRTIRYAAFGGGDLAPMRLDGPISAPRHPARAHPRVHDEARSDQTYVDAKVVSVGTRRTPSPRPPRRAVCPTYQRVDRRHRRHDGHRHRRDRVPDLPDGDATSSARPARRSSRSTRCRRTPEHPRHDGRPLRD